MYFLFLLLGVDDYKKTTDPAYPVGCRLKMETISLSEETTSEVLPGLSLNVVPTLC